MRDIQAQKSANLLKSLTHPCFNGCGGKNTRIHLPVAPSCNIQCNYCLRKYGCVNENRPGVTAQLLTPEEALGRFLEARQRLGKIDVAGIAGPGDALAEFDRVRQTFTLIRKADRGVVFCLSTNGLLLPRYAADIAALGVSHVTVTVNAASPREGKRIYRYVRYGGKIYTGAEGAGILLENQYEGISRLRDLGIVIKVNIVMLRDINDTFIPGIVAKVKEAGADMTNIMQLIPVPGTIFEHIPMVSNAELTETRRQCEALLPQMYHCRQCRSDAVGTLEEDISFQFTAGKDCGKTGRSAPEEEKAADDEGDSGRETPPLLFAAASKNGIAVDQHFGHASAFYIYQYKNGRVEFIEKRDVSRYCRGRENCGHNAAEWHEEGLNGILETLEDCDGVIAMRIGEVPRRRLAERGIRFFMTYDYVTDAVKEFGRTFVREMIHA
ncbi:MAG: nitrogenase cofactor biosynthesis protein NifB [Treponema sp.]|jgi:nitrogenase cofactor biosynthesis protein NifB|nr:nitrogenase cofactor biosynthesis protein NifB [Treponema sp.]